MTIIEIKEKVKKIINNIKQEQQGLNNQEKLENWEEKYTLQGEELEETKKKMERKSLYLIGKLEEKNKEIKLLKETNESEVIKELTQKYDERLSEQTRLNWDQLEELVELRKEVENLSKEVEKKDIAIENLIKENELWELIADTHLEALEVAQEWRERQLAEKLIALNRVKTWHIDYQSKVINDNEKLYSEQIKTLKLKSEELERQIFLQNSHTKGPVKMLRNKIKTKFQQLKTQKQKMVAKIEVKINK